MSVRPMLAAQKYRAPGDLWSEKHEEIVHAHLKEDGYLIAQPKWDGFRGLLKDGVMWSRSGKPLANNALQMFAKDFNGEFRGLDGEVFSGHNYHPEVFRATTSGIRTADGPGYIMIVVYDTIAVHEAPYTRRRQYLKDAYYLREGVPFDVVSGPYNVRLQLCPQKEVTSLEELYAVEAEYVAANFEGAIIRRPHKAYKFGRATAIGGELVKVKRRESYDAKVVGFEEGTENTNAATLNEIGYTTRSSHKENLVPNGRLGALRVRFVNGPYKGVEQKVGVFRGLSHSDLAALWMERETLPGRYCEVSVDPASGGYSAARCPVFLRWRTADEF